MAQESQDAGEKTVLAALAANAGIAVTKFVASALSGSSAMLAEGIHSVIDTANQGFLLLGKRRSERPPDEKHPFGYGFEVFFWAFVVACLLFSLGAGLSVYEGVRALLHGDHSHESFPWIPIVVLAIAFAFEGYSWSVAVGEFRRTRRGGRLMRDFRALKDPTIFVVLAEDTAALAGILIAAAGVILTWWTGNAVYDAAASILIGCALAVTAWVLATEVKGLLIGEAAAPEVVEMVEREISALDEIIAINEMRSMHLGPKDVLLTLSVDFEDKVPAGRIEKIVTRLERDVRREFPQVKRLFLEVQSVKGHEAMAEDGGPGGSD